MSKSGNRIPFEEVDGLTTWSLPSLGDGNIVPSVKKRDQQKKQQENIEDLGELPISPMTADQLEKITAEAEKEARELGFKEGREEGEKQGLAIGEKRAYEETKAQLEEQIQTFQSLTEQLLSPLDMQDQRVENWVIELAVQFTKHLIQHELTQDPKILFAQVQRVVSALPVGAEHIRIHVNDVDCTLLKEAFPNKDWRFESDPSLSRGGCRVETDHSVADYSIETRIQNLLDEAEFLEETDEIRPSHNYAPDEDAQDDDDAL